MHGRWFCWWWRDIHNLSFLLEAGEREWETDRNLTHSLPLCNRTIFCYLFSNQVTRIRGEKEGCDEVDTLEKSRQSYKRLLMLPLSWKIDKLTEKTERHPTPSDFGTRALKDGDAEKMRGIWSSIQEKSKTAWIEVKDVCIRLETETSFTEMAKRSKTSQHEGTTRQLLCLQ